MPIFFSYLSRFFAFLSHLRYNTKRNEIYKEMDTMKKTILLLGIIFFLLLILGVGIFFFWRHTSTPTENTLPSENISQEENILFVLNTTEIPILFLNHLLIQQQFILAYLNCQSMVQPALLLLLYHFMRIIQQMEMQKNLLPFQLEKHFASKRKTANIFVLHLQTKQQVGLKANIV